MTTTLLCFHHAGGSGASFRPWLTAGDPDVRVVPVALPVTRPVTGRRIHTDIDSVVDHVLDEHAEVLRGQHVLYGHSMGGLLAYLVARRLCTSHPGTPSLGLGAPARGARECGALTIPSALIVAASWSPRMRPSIDVDQLDDTELIDVLTQIGGIPADLAARPEWLAPTLPIVRDDLRLCGRYEHRHAHDTLPIPIRVVGADDDRLVTRAQTVAWADLSSDVHIEFHSGGHFFESDPAALRRRVFDLARETLDTPRVSA